MKDLVLYIVQNLVSNPDKVEVTEDRQDSEVRLMLSVDPKDMGIVIGRSGQTIKAIRKLLTVRAMNDNVRVYLNLNEPEGSDRLPEQAEKTETPDKE